MNKNIIDIKKIKKIFFHNNKKIELFKNVNISAFISNETNTK